MQITPEELKRAYREMGDEELLAMETDDLTETARKLHAAEIERRGLHVQAERDDSGPEGEEGHWETVGAFRSLHEAQLAHGLLQSAGIPAELESNSGDLLWMGSSGHRLSRVVVPEQFLDEAHGIIESHAVREELAAQAEAEPLPQVITARYEDGVFKPLDPVEWDEGTEVEVRVAGQ